MWLGEIKPGLASAMGSEGRRDIFTELWGRVCVLGTLTQCLLEEPGLKNVFLKAFGIQVGVFSEAPGEPGRVKPRITQVIIRVWVISSRATSNQPAVFTLFFPLDSDFDFEVAADSLNYMFCKGSKFTKHKCLSRVY